MKKNRELEYQESFSHHARTPQGPSDGGIWVYRYLYPQKSVKVNFLWGKNDARTAIQQFYTPLKKKLLYPQKNKFLATPLAPLYSHFGTCPPFRP